MNLKIDLAEKFINSTASHIFLTGKAGTGKTTFLRRLSEISPKNFLVIAPTGVAALNAGGVTIHSQFLLPFGTFIAADTSHTWEQASGNFYDGKTIARRNPLDSRRRKVLQSIDLLVIDEISMCRADIIDAIDYRLRSVRRNRKPFGGVQLLMIGDLFQLPPIVKDDEWQVLRQIYPSPHFFEALALKNSQFTYLELDKIYRQNEPEFIRLLNNLRNDTCSPEDLDLLNSRYKPDYQAEDGVITLVTHNNQANSINKQRLNDLKSPVFSYSAKIDGDFNEKLFPMPEHLELRVGAQVMFIKNDSDGSRFYNGKIVLIRHLEKDKVVVDLDGEDFEVPRLTWENRRFEMEDKSQELKEKILGSFEHYPLRLAWAVTIHKSQGLTFEKAIVDVGNAFAAGQVYVALSRLTGLQGLILKTKVLNTAILTDAQVQHFVKLREQEDLEEKLAVAKSGFLQESLLESFSFKTLFDTARYHFQKHHEKFDFDLAILNESPNKIQNELAAYLKSGETFQRQLYYLLQESDYAKIEERMSAGIEYYQKGLKELLHLCFVNVRVLEMHSGTKTLRDLYLEIITLLVKKFFDLKQLRGLFYFLVEERPLELAKSSEKEELLRELKDKSLEKVRGMSLNLKTKSGKVKKVTGQTYLETYQLVKKGFGPTEIALSRKLKQATIFNHLLRGLKEDKLIIGEIFSKEHLNRLKEIWDKQKSPDLMNLHYADTSISVDEWRVAMHYFRSTENKS